MKKIVRLYEVIVWVSDPDTPGKRISLFEESYDDVVKQLKLEYGEDITYTIHNEEDANKPR